jgi:hypothetical protein
MKREEATLGVKVGSIWDLVVIDGVNALLTSTLKNSLVAPLWYVSLIDNASFTGFVFTDNMGTHPSWFEFLSYSEGTRQQWVPGTVANGYVDNAGSRATFTISQAGTVRGGFLTSANNKNGNTGCLYGEAQFAVPRVVAASDLLIVKLAAQITSS